MEVLEKVSREEYLGGQCREKYEHLFHGFHGRFGDCQAVGAPQRKGKKGQQDRTGTAVLHQSQAFPMGVLEVMALSDTHIWFGVLGLL